MLGTLKSAVQRANAGARRCLEQQLVASCCLVLIRCAAILNCWGWVRSAGKGRSCCKRGRGPLSTGTDGEAKGRLAEGADGSEPGPSPPRTSSWGWGYRLTCTKRYTARSCKVNPVGPRQSPLPTPSSSIFARSRS